VEQYEAYIADHIGKEICEDHSSAAFDSLRAHFEYPHVTKDGERAYILVKEVEARSGFYRVLDGNHRASMLLHLGKSTVRVAVVSPRAVEVVVADPAPEATHLDEYAFNAFGAVRIRSRKCAKKMCESGALKLNGSSVFAGVFVKAGDVLSLDVSAEPRIVHTEASVVGKGEAGMRLDRYCQVHFKSVLNSKSLSHAACERGDVLVGGLQRPGNHQVKPGHRVTVHYDFLDARTRSSDKVEAIEVVHEDEDFAVVWKHAGIDTNGTLAKGARNLESLLPSFIRHSVRQDALPTPATVHRLDRATSGLVLVAKTVESRKKLIEMLATREVYSTRKTLLCHCLQHLFFLTFS